MSNRAVRVAWPALTVVAALVTLTVVLVLTGDASRTALGTGRPFARLAMGLATAATLGPLAAAVLEPAAARRERLLTTAGVAAIVQTAATGITGLLLYVGGAPAVGSSSFGPGLVTFLLELGVGRAWLGATAAAAVVSAVVLGTRSRRGAAVALTLALAALAPVALQATASGDSLAEARTAAAAAALRTVGAGLALGLSLVLHAGAPQAQPARLVVAGAIAVALVGSVSTALLRRDQVGAVALLDPVVLLVAAASALLALAPLAARAADVGRLVALAVASGIGAAPGLTDPVRATLAARDTPAAILTGEPLPASLDAAALLSTWRVDPLLLAVCLALLVGGLLALLRDRRAGTVSPARTAAWIGGVLVLAWLTCGGLAVYRSVLLGAFLTQLTGLLLVVPLLLAAGAPVAPRWRIDPRLAVAGVAVLLVLVAGTGALRWGIADPLGAEALLLLPVLAGGLLASAVLHHDGAGRAHAVQAIGALLLVEAAGGVLLLTTPGLLQADWFGAMGWGTDALVSQRSAAGAALLVAIPPTLVLLAAALRRRPRRDALTADAPLVREGADA